MSWPPRGMFQYTGVNGAPDPAFAFVTTLLHGTELVDRSQYNSSPVTLVGSASIDSTKKPYGSASFNFTGGTDGVSLPYNANRNPFYWSSGPAYATVECWINTAAAGTFPRVLELADAGYTNGSWNIYLNDTATGDVAFLYAGYSAAVAMLKSAGGLVNDSNWHHIAVTRSTTRWDLWVDGISRANITTAANVGAPAVPFLVGKAVSLARPLVGNVADVRLTTAESTALNASLACRYTSTFTPPTAPFSNY